MDSKKNILFLELNEFNADLLKEASEALQLTHIQKLVHMPQSRTLTTDTYESDFLEPWVQWVSVHTGLPSTRHQIKHLGDVPHLDSPQIWESLSEQGITSGVWGAMNAHRNGAEQCLFFLPDPWTASEVAFPNELNSLLMPLRYLCKNYLNRSNQRLLPELFGLLRLFARCNLLGPFAKELPQLIRNALRFKGEHFAFISFLDYLSTRLFLHYRKTHKPAFSLLFLNSLAHLQHHHWHGHNYRSNPRLSIGLRYIDRLLGHLFASLDPDTLFIATNALSQKNTNEETPWILYRQLDQKAFLNQVGLYPTRVESHMTHDAHLYFSSTESCQTAYKQLSEARIKGHPLFLVESYPQEPLKLFYRICFTEQLPLDATFSLAGRTYPFFRLFKPIVERTGKHIPQGTLFASDPIFPDILQNHEIFDQILSYFNLRARSAS